jgi:hypothetical protein
MPQALPTSSIGSPALVVCARAEVALAPSISSSLRCLDVERRRRTSDTCVRDGAVHEHVLGVDLTTAGCSWSSRRQNAVAARLRGNRIRWACVENFTAKMGRRGYVKLPCGLAVVDWNLSMENDRTSSPDSFWRRSRRLAGAIGAGGDACVEKAARRSALVGPSKSWQYFF